MSVTSATESFTDGAELFEQDKYQSTVQTSLEPDTTQIEQEFKKPLSQRIIPMHSHTKSVYGESRLDDVIVRCPSLAFRDHQKQQWNDVKKEAEEKSWNWTITAMGAGVFAALGGALMAMDPAAVAGYVGTAIANSYLAPFVLVAGAVGAAVSIIFVANANSSINQANEQINKWDADPVMKVGQARNEAHKQGFPYIYANNLKLTSGQPSRTALFHPIQVEYEYKKYFESFCRNLLSQANPSPASWMNQFRSCNPVSASYMTYALGAVPDRMTLVIQDYSRLALLLEDIVKSYDQLKIDVRKTAKDRIDSYNKAKNEQLQPLAQARDEGIATAEDNKDRVLRDLNASDRRRREARETFNVIKESLQANYTRSAAPISKKYDGKIKEVENESNERIGKLDDQKGSQLGNNYRAARELLARAKQAWDNKGYQPVNFQQYFPYQTAQPVWVNQQPGYYQQQPPAYQQPVQVVYQQQPPVQQQPGYYQQPVQPVYQQQ
ncbi:MAG TPA: hypothetical protein VIJ14_01080, partial [Rhabdochlamydiaceae bacterium]